MNPTPGQVTAIKQFVAGLVGTWSNTDAQIRAAMASQTQANPVAQPTIPKPFTYDDIIGAVSSINQINVAALASAIPSFLEDVDANNVPRLVRWGKILRARNLLTVADMTALGAVVNATQPDPAWPSVVGWDVAHLGRAADDFDIEAARVSAGASG
jgi:hypothetical protein